MTTSDQTESATLAGLRATLDKRRLPGPRDAEVIPLAELVRLFRMCLCCQPLEARRVAVDMLSGAVGDGFDWRGSAAHQLPIFERTTLGTFEVSGAGPRPEDGDGVTAYPPERDKALARFLSGEPLPWLVVHKADACAAFGINDLLATMPPIDPAPIRALENAMQAICGELMQALPPQSAAIVAETSPRKTWQERALELRAKDMTPTAIVRKLGLAELLGVSEDAARQKVRRLDSPDSKPQKAGPWDALNRA